MGIKLEVNCRKNTQLHKPGLSVKSTRQTWKMQSENLLPCLLRMVRFTRKSNSSGLCLNTWSKIDFCVPANEPTATRRVKHEQRAMKSMRTVDEAHVLQRARPHDHEHSRHRVVAAKATNASK